jgi:hypothetical protein
LSPDWLLPETDNRQPTTDNRLHHMPRWWMAALGCGIMTVVAVWLWLRPEPPAVVG